MSLERWTCVEASSAHAWREEGGAERTRLPAVAYPLGAAARTCEAAAGACFIYADVAVDMGTATVQGKSQAWRRTDGLELAWFDAHAFTVGDTLTISW